MSKELKALFFVMFLIVVGAVGAVYYRYTIIRDDAVGAKATTPTTTHPVTSTQKDVPEEVNTKAVETTKVQTTQPVAATEEDEDVSDSGLTAEEEETEMDKEEGGSFGVIDMKSSAEAEDE